MPKIKRTLKLVLLLFVIGLILSYTGTLLSNGIVHGDRLQTVSTMPHDEPKLVHVMESPNEHVWHNYTTDSQIVNPRKEINNMSDSLSPPVNPRKEINNMSDSLSPPVNPRKEINNMSDSLSPPVNPRKEINNMSDSLSPPVNPRKEIINKLSYVPTNLNYLSQYHRFTQYGNNVSLKSIPRGHPSIQGNREKYAFTIAANATFIDPREYQYNISIKHTGEFTIRLLEIKSDGDFTKGGSSFRTECENRKFIWCCDEMDFFNGTYLIECPSMPYINKLHVSVKVMYTNFAAYQFKHRPLNHVILNKTLSFKLAQSINATTRPHFHKGKNGSLNWVLRGESIPHVDRTAFFNCLKKYDLYMIGDSHVRELFKYMAWLRSYDYSFDGVSKDLGRVDFPNLHSIFAKKWHNVFELLKNESFTTNLSNNSVLLISCISWDLNTQHAAQPLRFFKGFKETLEQLKYLKSKTNMRIIWMTGPAYLNSNTSWDGRVATGRRNNFIIGAMNQWIYLQVKDLGHILETLDIFTMTSTKPDEAVGHHHYSQLPNRFEKKYYEDPFRDYHGKLTKDLQNIVLNFVCKTI